MRSGTINYNLHSKVEYRRGQSVLAVRSVYGRYNDGAGTSVQFNLQVMQGHRIQHPPKLFRGGRTRLNLKTDKTNTPSLSESSKPFDGRVRNEYSKMLLKRKQLKFSRIWTESSQNGVCHGTADEPLLNGDTLPVGSAQCKPIKFKVMEINSYGKTRKQMLSRRDVLALTSLDPRDLRRIDAASQFKRTSLALYTKKGSIVFNIFGVKAIASQERCFIFDYDERISKTFISTVIPLIQETALVTSPKIGAYDQQEAIQSFQSYDPDMSDSELTADEAFEKGSRSSIEQDDLTNNGATPSTSNIKHEAKKSLVKRKAASNDETMDQEIDDEVESLTDQGKDQSFPLVVTEAALLVISALYEQELQTTSQIRSGLLKEIRSRKFQDLSSMLNQYKDKLGELHSKMEQLRELLYELLEDREELLNFNLSAIERRDREFEAKRLRYLQLQQEKTYSRVEAELNQLLAMEERQNMGGRFGGEVGDQYGATSSSSYDDEGSGFDQGPGIGVRGNEIVDNYIWKKSNAIRSGKEPGFSQEQLAQIQRIVEKRNQTGGISRYRPQELQIMTILQQALRIRRKGEPLPLELENQVAQVFNTLGYEADFKEEVEERQLDEDVEVVEDIIEYYLQRVASTEAEAERLLDEARNFDSQMALNLSAKRYQLQQFELYLSMFSLIAGVGAMIGGIFGMNLTSTFESSIFGFYFVTALIVILCIILYLRMMNWANKYQLLYKVQDPEPHQQPSWNEDKDEHHNNVQNLMAM